MSCGNPPPEEPPPALPLDSVARCATGRPVPQPVTRLSGPYPPSSIPLRRDAEPDTLVTANQIEDVGHPKGRSAAKEPRSGLTRRSQRPARPASHMS